MASLQCSVDGGGYGYDGGYEPADDGDDELPMLACEPEGAPPVER